jgi:hypothetical protein
MKDHDIDPHESGAHNPYQILLHKLTETTIQKPQLKASINVRRKTQCKEIDIKAKKIIEKENTTWSKHAAVWDKVAWEMYDLLPQEEKSQ